MLYADIKNDTVDEIHELARKQIENKRLRKK